MQGRTYHHPSRSDEFNRIVYSGADGAMADLDAIVQVERPGPSPYNIYWGEIHGHTELSDGVGAPDDYFRAARDRAGLDFCVLTDHDHGGVGRAELWGDKWELTQQKVAEYHDPSNFVTLLGYERDSYPYYSNLCLYYRSGQADMVRGQVDGQITREELLDLLGRDDVIAIPHHCTSVSQGVSFDALDMELMTPLMEVYSKWGTAEYAGNPRPTFWAGPGGEWQVALERGAKMGCVAGSDIHSPHPGIWHKVEGVHTIMYPEPGLCAVLATELTREAVFDALKARRCYASAGVRVAIDFRINGAVMGQEISLAADQPRKITLAISGSEPLAEVVVVKNGRNHFVNAVGGLQTHAELLVSDLRAERATDYYYVRVTMHDGRQAWTSPIWISQT